MINALDIQRARASAIARELLARAPADSIACILAGGSLGRGEAWAAGAGDELEVYSDVDLYVVVEDSESLAAVRACAATVAAAAPGIEGVRFLRPPDVGVYSRSDLLAQPARPGTIDLPVNHLLLHGDPALPTHLPAPDPGRIAAEEALYLLENRVVELAASERTGDGPEGRMALVRSLKARLDVHAAHAIVDGSFAPTLAMRAGRFASAPPSSIDAGAREDIASAYRAAADPGAWFPDQDAAAETEHALRALTLAWRALAPRVLNARADARPETLVALRCRAGRRRENAREAIRLRRVAALPLWRSVVTAAALSRLSPRAALRLDALVRVLHAQGNYDARHLAAHGHYVDRLTRRFGFTTGPQEMRVRAMHRVIS